MVIKQNKNYKLPMSKLEIIQKYDEGMSTYALGKICNCSAINIRRILKQGNVSLRTLSEAATKYTYDKNYFKNINSEEKAYFLGLLFADGNVFKKTMSISLQEQDKNILEQFKNSIKYTGPLLINNKLGNRQPQFRLSITSKSLAIDLGLHGICKNKAFHILFPKYISEKLFRHFIRGYFDGDGCIYTNPTKNDYLISMIGPKLFLEDIQKILIDNLGLSQTKLYNPKNCKETDLHTLTYQGKKNVLKIGQFLYQDASCFIHRKYDKYLTIAS